MGCTLAMRYRMHFDASNLPPVLAFWSVTAYDKDGYFIANPINRYAIGDRDRLKFDPDGSLDLYIQSEDPRARSPLELAALRRRALESDASLVSPETSHP